MMIRHIQPDKSQERRSYRRTQIHLPLTCRQLGKRPESTFQVLTLNVSAGGLYFETMTAEIRPGDKLSLRLAVPPDDKYVPIGSTINTLGKVVRACHLHDSSGEDGRTTSRWGVAVQFQEKLKLSF